MLLLLFGFAQAEPLLSRDDLVYDWNLLSVQPVAGTGQGAITLLKDKLALRADGSFDLHISSTDYHESGRWSLRNDSLVLVYELTLRETGIDSTVFLPEGDVPTVIYFSNGKEVARQSGNELYSRRRTETYGIRLDAAHNATFTGTGRTIQVYQTRRFEPQPFSIIDIVRGLIGILVLLIIA